MKNRYQLTYDQLNICRAFIGMSADQFSIKDPALSKQLDMLLDKVCEMLDSDLDFEYSDDEKKLFQLCYEKIMKEFDAEEFHPLFGFEKEEAEVAKEEIFKKLKLLNS